MKKFYLCLNTLICLSFLFTLNSCSTDTSFVSGDTPESVDAKNEFNYFNSKKANAMPSNTENPYDSDGQVYHDLFKDDYKSDGLQDLSSSISKHIESVAYTKTTFNKMHKKDNSSMTVAKGTNVILHSTISFSDIIENSNMGAVAKLSLIDFIHSLQFLSKKGERYAVLYAFVVKYEMGILVNPLLTETDKKIILTTSSIARYSTYAATTESVEAIDPDWTILIGHLVGETGSTN